MIERKIQDTLHFIRPNAQWVLRGEDLEWLDKEQKEPTKAEIEAGFAQYNAWKSDQDATKAAAKTAAEAKLAALGLTAEDLKALGL